MNINVMDGIKPYVRFVKIEKRGLFAGGFLDYDNVFTLITAGRCSFILDGENYDAKENDVIIMPPCTPHFIHCDTGQPITEYVFHFDLYDHNSYDFREHLMISDHIGGLQEKRARREEEMLLAGFPPVMQASPEEALELKRMFLYMHKEFSERQPGYLGVMSAIAQQMLINVYRNALLKQSAPNQNTIKYWNNARRVIEVVQMRYATDLSVGEIAKEVGLTPNHLSTLFKNNLGISIYSYLNMVRIESAKQMLYEGNMNVTQIAERCGFSSIHTFSRAFKRITGISPIGYSRSLPAPAASGGR